MSIVIVDVKIFEVYCTGLLFVVVVIELYFCLLINVCYCAEYSNRGKQLFCALYDYVYVTIAILL